ncbi:MAG: hypothetical protein DRJ42_18995 [Deltaproteobacteria bacterium]|nr:MAG: hypothetical protein DRJ42_18995 [Deltaproteobacteria bacterium]
MNRLGSILRLALLIVFLGISGSPAIAAAQASAPPPVALTAVPLFGEPLLLPRAHVPLLVTAENRTRGTLTGQVVVEATHHAAGRRRYEIAMDLPPGEERQVVVTPAVLEGSSITTTYRVDGRTLATALLHPGFSMAIQGIVLLDNPSHLRGALLEMDIEEPPIDIYSSPRMVRVPVGIAPVDGRSMDLILPTNAAGWSTVRMILASAPSLEGLPVRERTALLDWLRAGGDLVLFLRSDADLRAPALGALFGPAEVIEVPRASEPSGLVPGDGPLRQLTGAGVRREAFGGSKRVGFGRVYAVTYEGTSPRLAAAPETRSLVMAILARSHVPGTGAPSMALGRLDDGYPAGNARFETLRPSLDPNEGYRLALVLVAFVLLFYVVLVGPVNFYFVGKRGKPTLALLTTPIAAAACLLVLLAVGYIGKGTRMRYRAVEVVEVVEGDHRGPARRYSGLFLTRPLTFDFPAPPGTLAFDIAAGGEHPAVEVEGAGTTLRSIRGGLWETVFIREDHIRDLGGEVVFQRRGRRVVGVINGTSRDLRGAVVIDGVGAVYRIGDVPVGGTAAVPGAVAMTLGTERAFWGTEDELVGQLAEAMGIDRDRRDLLPGIASLLGGHLTVNATTVLFAFSEVDRGEVADTFGAEFDYQFIRVVPDLERGER